MQHSEEIEQIIKEYIEEELESSNVEKYDDEELKSFISETVDELFVTIDDKISEIMDNDLIDNSKSVEEDENKDEENNEEERWRNSY